MPASRSPRAVLSTAAAPVALKDPPPSREPTAAPALSQRRPARRRRGRPGPPAPLLLATACPPCPAPANAGLTRILRLISVPISMARRRAARSTLRGASVTWNPPRAATLQPAPLGRRSASAVRVPAPAGAPVQVGANAHACVHTHARAVPGRGRGPEPVLWRPLLVAQRTMAYRLPGFTLLFLGLGSHSSSLKSNRNIAFMGWGVESRALYMLNKSSTTRCLVPGIIEDTSL